jgi:hypothetical protein
MSGTRMHLPLQPEEEFRAWAIAVNDDDGRKYQGYIGEYWWFHNKSPNIPKHLEGCRIALFVTRKLAREHLEDTRIAFPKSKIVQVKVTVKAIP